MSADALCLKSAFPAAGIQSVDNLPKASPGASYALVQRKLRTSAACKECHRQWQGLASFHSSHPLKHLQKQSRTWRTLTVCAKKESENGYLLPPNAHKPRPRRIILVRHGESEGNVDESVYTRIPDSKIALTEKGMQQAMDCGKRLRQIMQGDGDDDWKVYFYVSPYKRSLQTLRGIGSQFERHRIAGVREEPRIREQDFGNFQDHEKMRKEKETRLRYGRFFYRFPDGESAADVYDRITGFRETLRADIDYGRFQHPDSCERNMNLVMVSHGLTLRVFLMRWYKWTVEQFEGLYNFGNTGVMIMQLGPGNRYSLAMHHSHDELRSFGMTDEMIADQEWQTTARPGELNHDWMTSGPSFFDEDMEPCGLIGDESACSDAFDRRVPHPRIDPLSEIKVERPRFGANEA